MSATVTGDGADTWWDTLVGWSGQLEHGILALAGSPWIYPSVGGVSFLDAIFPVVPSESVVIASGTAAAQTGSPILALIWVAAVVGAWCGDQVTYTIGQLVDVRRVPLLRGEKGRAVVHWAEHALEHRGTSFIIAARFIPMGRIAVNLSAGALRYPRRRFMVIDAIAVSIWAAYGIGLGTLAGNLVEGNLLLSIGVGVVGGVVLGYLVDLLLQRIGVKPPDLPDIDELPTGETPRQAAKRARADG